MEGWNGAVACWQAVLENTKAGGVAGRPCEARDEAAAGHVQTKTGLASMGCRTSLVPPISAINLPPA